jgi:hypothetical protein
MEVLSVSVNTGQLDITGSSNRPNTKAWTIQTFSF